MQPQQTSDRIRAWLAAKLQEGGHSKSDFAKMIGLSPSAVSRIFSGERQVSSHELFMIVHELGLSLYELDAILKDALDEVAPKRRHVDYPNPDDMAAQSANYLKAGLYADELSYVDNSLVRIAPFDELQACYVPASIIAKPENKEASLRWMKVQDDAMAPTIIPGDVIFFTVKPKYESLTGLFVLEDGSGGALIRRIDPGFPRKDGSRPVRIIADNSRYGSTDTFEADLRLVGQVSGKVTSQLQ